MTKKITNNIIHAFFPIFYEIDQKIFDKDSKVHQISDTILNKKITDDFLKKYCPDIEYIKLKEIPSLWKKSQPGEWQDFYSNIRQILGVSSKPTICLSFELADKTLLLLSQLKGGKPRLFFINLNSGAKQRSGIDSIYFQINNANLYLFRTGVAILDISWHYCSYKKYDPNTKEAKDLKATNDAKKEIEDNNHTKNKYNAEDLKIEDGDIFINAILEGNYFLSHNNENIPNNHKKNDNIKTDSAVLTADKDFIKDLSKCLIPDIGINRYELDSHRTIIYTLTNIQDDKTLDDKLLISARLSRRWTSDYAPNIEIINKNYFLPFPYIMHMPSLEGGATTVYINNDTPEVVKNFINNQANNTYIPIYIAALHSHLWLLNKTQIIPTRQFGKDSKEEKKYFSNLLESIIEFKRFFHNILISQISMHNDFYNLLQKKLKINERLNTLEDITSKNTQIISERRIRWIAPISGAIGGMILTKEILDIIAKNGIFLKKPTLKSIFVDIKYHNLNEVKSLIQLSHNWDIIIFIGSIIGGVLGLVLAWYFDAKIKK
jgi:hypothetical protein